MAGAYAIDWLQSRSGLSRDRTITMLLLWLAEERFVVINERNLEDNRRSWYRFEVRQS